MAKTEQSRQKKLAKKRSKEIAKRKRLMAEKNALKSVAGQIAASMRLPIDRCYAYASLMDEAEDDGAIGAVLVTRPIPDGRLVFACFLVDKACLGVKDAFARLVTPAQFSDHLDRLRSSSKLIKCDPIVAKKLVTDAVQWAAQFGLDPLGDYERTSRIWHDVDESQCEQTFRFGRNGKPCYIQGPHDSPQFIRRVMESLSQHAGEGNYHFTHQIDAPEGIEALFDAEGNPMAQDEIVLPNGDKILRIDRADD